MSEAKYDFDVIVIGGGSGGYAAARTAASKGLQTAVIDGAEELSGLCILRGCMPSKALLYAAEVKHLAEHGATWGLRIPEVSFDFAAVMARKAAMIKDFADYRVKQLNDGRFKLFRACAQFVDAHTIALSDGQQLTAKNFIISTGSVVSPPPLPEMQSIGYLTSDDILTLQKLPKSVIVLGGGAIAVELAQFLARFDVKVTIIQRSAHLMSACDVDAGEVIETVFKKEGMTVYAGTKLKVAFMQDGQKGIEFEQDGKTIRVQAQEILHALGRTANTGSLALDKAGVNTEKGRIITDAQQRTSAPHIFAAGDCCGPHEIVHIAIQQGEIAVHNIVSPKHPRTMDYRLLISIIFTDPQVANVGLTEKEAKKQNIPYLTASYPFADHGKSMIMEAMHGFVKLLADPKTGEIIGGSCVGPSGGELIHEIVAAMAKRMTVHELAAMPHYHPTLAEIWTYPAEELADQIVIR
ncbi:MAG: pyridine nucleotide-disulfide oxidoreductase [Verrucomicrobia bacterium]|jgi:pyruvate/2-oxoglutarate dehydrogenase complex dihydrolipoamide dehydrogenase (E3) component|nr:pyridine nucleotide-disulfide oxidoreductase [Verrucomicrobiota bacterium]